MTVTLGTRKSDLHKQNVSVCFFSKQKCASQSHFIKKYLLQLFTIKIVTPAARTPMNTA
jgi:hypothetical protein